ncbi:hypothetical protein PV396_09130 [Streptomyces sp. ME02-8801-2C]|uniref:hypothetical protein n=1 Tax=Streptomyces sp. ME02-8801-2C TaxID=3028680 RepID=UPI0029BB72B0|nr:hypothetical protein [Streptomyces sp. ME02-8801-2C]MDX3452102.1 hypothetical protein [Streptomyces sp. ME02-8801-2C]
MDEDPEVRRSAFDLYLALHHLLESQTLGLVITSVRDTKSGATHDALAQLDQRQDVVKRRHPDLLKTAHDAVISPPGVTIGPTGSYSSRSSMRRPQFPDRSFRSSALTGKVHRVVGVMKGGPGEETGCGGWGMPGTVRVSVTPVRFV